MDGTRKRGGEKTEKESRDSESVKNVIEELKRRSQRARDKEGVRVRDPGHEGSNARLIGALHRRAQNVANNNVTYKGGIDLCLVQDRLEARGQHVFDV